MVNLGTKLRNCLMSWSAMFLNASFHQFLLPSIKTPSIWLPFMATAPEWLAPAILTAFCFLIRKEYVSALPWWTSKKGSSHQNFFFHWLLGMALLGHLLQLPFQNIGLQCSPELGQHAYIVSYAIAALLHELFRFDGGVWGQHGFCLPYNVAIA